jgi:hypothetical protein
MPGAGFLHILPASGFPGSKRKLATPAGVFAAGDSRSIPQGAQASSSKVQVLAPEMRTASGIIMCLYFSYHDSIRTRAWCILRCIPSQVCFEPLTRTRTAQYSTAQKRRPTASGSEYCVSGRTGDAEQSFLLTSILTMAAGSRIALWSTPACAVLFKHAPFSRVAFKRSSKHNHISRYRSKVQASRATIAVSRAQEGGCLPAAGGRSFNPLTALGIPDDRENCTSKTTLVVWINAERIRIIEATVL